MTFECQPPHYFSCHAFDYSTPHHIENGACPHKVTNPPPPYLTKVIVAGKSPSRINNLPVMRWPPSLGQDRGYIKVGFHYPQGVWC